MAIPTGPLPPEYMTCEELSKFHAGKPWKALFEQTWPVPELVLPDDLTAPEPPDAKERVYRWFREDAPDIRRR